MGVGWLVKERVVLQQLQTLNCWIVVRLGGVDLILGIDWLHMRFTQNDS